MNSLSELGWKGVFQQQLSLTELEDCVPGRIFEVQRSGVTVVFEAGECHLALAGRWFQEPEEERPTVGDWVLLDTALTTVVRLLERTSVLSRVSPSQDKGVQLIAANLDTLLIVTSCNADFNASRLERYIALAMNAGIEPVLVLTKRDLAADAERYLEAARDMDRTLAVEMINARDPADAQRLSAWCGPGQTVALVGSSGVGKSTLVNTLLGEDRQVTREIRSDDSKGRHTTTHRSLHLIPGGGLLLDSPGIRELQLADVEEGLEATFDDVELLAAACQFRDCKHQGEPGCAVGAAIASGDLDERRLANYHKLKREHRFNTETIAERHDRVRRFGRIIKKASQRRKERDS